MNFGKSLSYNWSNMDSHFAVNHSELYTWGTQYQGELGRGGGDESGVFKPSLKKPQCVDFELDVQQVVAGDARTMVLTTSGDVYHWGRIFGRAVDVNPYHPLMLLWVDINWRPVCISGGIRVKRMYCADAYCIFQTYEHELYSMGSSSHGQLGTGDVRASKKLKRVDFGDVVLKEIVSLSLGIDHVLAIVVRNRNHAIDEADDEDDDDVVNCVYGWGLLTNGALGVWGIGPEEYTVPTIISGLRHRRWSKVACGNATTVLLSQQNQVYVMGTWRTTCVFTTPSKIQCEHSSPVVDISMGDKFVVLRDEENQCYWWPPAQAEFTLATYQNVNPEVMTVSVADDEGQELQYSKFLSVTTSPTSTRLGVVTMDRKMILHQHKIPDPNNNDVHAARSHLLTLKGSSLVDESTLSVPRNDVNVVWAIGARHYAVLLKEYRRCSPQFSDVMPTWENDFHAPYADLQLSCDYHEFYVHRVFLNTRLGTMLHTDWVQWGVQVRVKGTDGAAVSKSALPFEDGAPTVPDIDTVNVDTDIGEILPYLLEWVYTNSISRLPIMHLPFLMKFAAYYNIETLHESLSKLDTWHASHDDDNDNASAVCTVMARSSHGLSNNECERLSGRNHKSLLNGDLVKAVDQSCKLFGYDVTFEVDGAQFHAHKCVLSARCSYFANMFRVGGLSESVRSVIEFPDTSIHTFRAFMVWIYCDVVKTSVLCKVDNLKELFVLSDLIAATNLKRQCEEEMYRHVFRVNNWCVRHPQKPEKPWLSLLRPVAHSVGNGHFGSVVELDESSLPKPSVLYWLTIAEKYRAVRLKELIWSSPFVLLPHLPSAIDECTAGQIDEIHQWVPDMLNDLTLRVCRQTTGERLIKTTIPERAVVMPTDLESMESTYAPVVGFNATRVVLLIIATLLTLRKIEGNGSGASWISIAVVFSCVVIGTMLMLLAHLYNSRSNQESWWKEQQCVKKSEFLQRRTAYLQGLRDTLQEWHLGLAVASVNRELRYVSQEYNQTVCDIRNAKNEWHVPFGNKLFMGKSFVRGVSIIVFVLVAAYYADYESEVNWLNAWWAIIVDNVCALSVLTYESVKYAKMRWRQLYHQHVFPSVRRKAKRIVSIAFQTCLHYVSTPSGVVVFQSLFVFRKTMGYTSVSWWTTWSYTIAAFSILVFVIVVIDIFLICVAITLLLFPHLRPVLSNYLTSLRIDPPNIPMSVVTIVLFNGVVGTLYSSLFMYVSYLDSSDPSVSDTYLRVTVKLLLTSESIFFAWILWYEILRHHLWAVYQHHWRPSLQ